MGQYTIQSICQETGISQQTFYRLMRDDDSFRAVVERDRRKKRNSYLYGESVVSWLRDRYSAEQTDVGMSQDERVDKEEDASADDCVAEIDSTCVTETVEHDAACESSEEDGTVSVDTSAEDDRARYRQQIDAMQRQLDANNEVIRGLMAQNANLLMLLGQEKMEKQALMPAHPEPLLTRIRRKFTGK